MEIHINEKLREVYPDAQFVAIAARNFPNEKKNAQLEKERKQIQKKIQNMKDLSNIKQIKDHRAFHDKFGKSYPIEFQLNSIKKGKEIPQSSTLKDILFLSEMKQYCISSGHDMRTLQGQLAFDISQGGESYITIGGREQKLKAEDIILRDGNKIIATLRYGPDGSTKVTEQTKDCIYLFWFSSHIKKKDLDKVIAAFKKYLKSVAGKNSSIEEIPLTIESAQQAKVTPWEVQGDVDYDRLIQQFGVKKIDDRTLKAIKKVDKRGHHFLRRKIFYAHMYFDEILKAHQKKEPFYLYTGRAPSGPVHIGHLIPWIFAKWLQDTFQVNLLFQIPDEEKFLFNEKLTLEDTKSWAKENILDIIALGFDPNKTKIFLDTEYAGHMYKHACRIAKKITFSTVKSAFGFENDKNIGIIFYTAMQSVPAILPSIMENKPTRVLIPCAIDQDAHFRLTRDVAESLGYPKPATILCRFLPGLRGMDSDGKMSSSSDQSTIWTTDGPATVQKKINKYAFSGGQDTVEAHRKNGGNPDIDVAYQWLTFFEEDDKKLEKIHKDYKSGKLLTGELKKICAERLNEFLKQHQRKRELAKKQVSKFMLRD